MGLRTGVSKGRNLFSFYYLIMCRSKGNIGNRGNVGIDQSTCTQFVNFSCVVYCTRHRYWGYRRLKQNQCPSVAWLSWKRGMQIYLQRISDKRENPKWEWPVWFWIALVRCSYLFVSVFSQTQQTHNLSEDDQMPSWFLASGLPLPHGVSSPFTCSVLPSSQRWLPEDE